MAELIKRFIKKKRGVSLMISYAILIAIAILMAVGIFSWLKVLANVKPVHNCEEGTSLMISRKECSIDGLFKITLKNNGRFSINGSIIRIGDDDKKIPVIQLKPVLFEIPLNPGETRDIIFNLRFETDISNNPISINQIKVIRIQPFIIEKNIKVMCDSAIIVENFNGCIIR